MLKNMLLAFFALVLLSFASLAQNEKSSLTKWEYLEISGTRYNGNARTYRDYNYLTSETRFDGKDSLEWMKESGWELVGVVNNSENPISLFFKRPFDKARTTSEIERLKKEYATQKPATQTFALIDLDEQELARQLADKNKSASEKLRADIEKITNLPLKVISVKSNFRESGKPLIGAEIVLDATSVLLRDGGNYRSSEAEKYLRDAAKQIGEAVGITPDSYQANRLSVSTKMTEENLYKPVPIGEFILQGPVELKISVIITSGGQQNIVAQSYMRGWQIKETKETAAK